MIEPHDYDVENNVMENTEEGNQLEEENVEECDDNNENNKHLNTFVDSVKEYVSLDDQLKAAQKDMQLLKARKQNLTLAIMGFMQSQDWDVCNISTGGKLVMKKSKTKTGVKKDVSNTKLAEHFKDNKEVMKHLPTIMKMIFDDRETSEKDVLRRTTTRAKK